MKVRITRRVPGLTNGVHCEPGNEVVMPTGLAMSLLEDGYAVMVGDPAVGRAAPAERRETRPGRPRKDG
jgi:hypothetical protein